MAEKQTLVTSSGTSVSTVWQCDGIRLGHAVSTFKQLTSFAAASTADVVRMHFGLKGDYRFVYKQLGKTFDLAGSHHNIMYSQGFNMVVENKTPVLETFGIQFPRELFIQFTQHAGGPVQRFAEKIMAGKNTMLADDCKVYIYTIKQHTMDSTMIVTNTITIQAPAAAVWDALTNPGQTKKYMFGCETVSDWQAGSPLLWKGVFNGMELVAVKGYIKAIEPGTYLAYTVIDPNNPAIPDVPENYLAVTYSLAEEAGHTILTVTQSGFETAAEGERRYQETYNNGEGWNPILVQIKKVVEEG